MLAMFRATTIAISPALELNVYNGKFELQALNRPRYFPPCSASQVFIHLNIGHLHAENHTLALDSVSKLSSGLKANLEAAPLTHEVVLRRLIPRRSNTRQDVT